MTLYIKIRNYFKKYFLKYTVYEEREPITINAENKTDSEKDCMLFNGFYFLNSDGYFNEEYNKVNQGIDITNALTESGCSGYYRILNSIALCEESGLIIRKFRIQTSESVAPNSIPKSFMKRMEWHVSDENDNKEIKPFLPSSFIYMYSQKLDAVDIKLTNLNLLLKITSRVGLKITLPAKTNFQFTFYICKIKKVGYFEYMSIVKKTKRNLFDAPKPIIIYRYGDNLKWVERLKLFANNIFKKQTNK